METSKCDDDSAEGVSQQVGQEVLSGWSKFEKFELLQGLKYAGTSDLDQLCEYVPSKTKEEVKEALIYYFNKIEQGTINHKDHNKIIKTSIPLTSWANLLTDTLSFAELQTETAIALRLIAELEKLPNRLCTEGIDFRQIYHTIANAMEGKSITNDKNVLDVLNKAIVETALSSRAFFVHSKLVSIINSLQISNNDDVLLKCTNDTEVSTIRHLINQRSFNPLNVSEEYLKPLHFK